MKASNRPPYGVVVFTVLYLAVAAHFAFIHQNWEFIFYIAVVLILALLALTVNKYVGLSNGVFWSLSFWGLMHMVGGLVPLPADWAYNGTKAVFYSWWIIPDLLKYDHVVHAFGFGVCTWICWQALKPALTDKEPRFGVLALCVLGSMGLGAINEVVEFAAVLLIPDTNVGGYINTGWDLVSNAFGAVMAALFIASKPTVYDDEPHVTRLSR